MNTPLKVYTFGRFQISDEVRVMPNATTKKSKMWSALKYLIAFHGKPVSAERLAEILWPDVTHEDPAKMLRDVIYRLRKALSVYDGDEPYIVFTQGSYQWNPEIDCWIDVLEFGELINQARDVTRPDDERMELYNAAIDLYAGPFLSDSDVELWTVTFTDYYRKLFLQVIVELADLYEEDSMLEETIALLDKATVREPYEENLHIRQIQALISNGDYAHAKQQYRLFERVLMREFGVEPSLNFTRLHYEIDRAAEKKAGSIEEITQLFETDDKRKGALLCGPETFRQIYILDKRSEERIRFPIYLALVNLALPSHLDEIESENELKEGMRALRKVLMQYLRSGDVIAQYSKSQFVLMLAVKDDRNGAAAMHRIKYLFETKFGSERGNLEYNLSPIGKEGEGFVTDEKGARRSTD